MSVLRVRLKNLLKPPLFIAAVLLAFAVFGFSAVGKAYGCCTNEIGVGIISGGVHKELMSEFSTYYGDSAANRKHNIALAVSALDGLTIEPLEKLSFNAVVGARTEDRGYLEARVIEGGVYVSGIGGGVCQVSSTLYNTWVLAGLEVEEVHCHTLPSSYVGVSRDAAVSEYKDLRLINNSDAPVYLTAAADGEDIVIAAYGKKSSNTFAVETEIIGEIEPKEIELVEIKADVKEATFEVKRGKNGYHTKAYLITKEANGNITKREIRDDWYAPVKHKVIKRVPK